MKADILKTSVVFLSVPALVLLAAAGCGGGSSEPAATPSIPSGSGQITIREGTVTPAASSSLPARSGDFASLCKKSTEKQFTAPATVIDPSRGYTATITTDKGDIEVELDPQAAPFTVNSFVFLACSGFYDGVTFHRVVPGFVAQGGDPTGTGRGGPGYTIPDEYSNLPFTEGTLAMASTGPNTNSGGSQFFICYDMSEEQQAALQGKYTVFGKVTGGLDVVKALTPRDPSADGPPGDKILEITVQEQ